MRADAIPLLGKAAAAHLLYVCDISFWEVAMKAAAGKLVFSLDPTIWMQQAERAPGILYLPLDRPTLIQSTRIEKEMHGDPADRMLIAAAQLHSAALVTADKQIIGYARRSRRVSVCDIRK
jgi:PIN domain nuclease of toxin-antitoxin system